MEMEKDQIIIFWLNSKATFSLFKDFACPNNVLK